MAAEKRVRHSTRRAVLVAVRNNPGIHQAGLANLLDLAPTTIKHHRRKLEKSRKIRVVHLSGELAFYPAELPAKLEAPLRALSRPGSKPILNLVQSEGPISLQEIANHLEVSRKVAKRYLVLLRAQGWVTRTSGHRGLYSIPIENNQQ